VGAVGAIGVVGGAATPAFAQGATGSAVTTATPRPGTRNGSFELMEATVADIHDAYRRGQLTCRELVQQYLDRIAAFDKQGPSLKAMITVNPRALEVADELDRQFRRSGLTGPLHGIPIVLKDIYNTADMPTTGGNVAMRDSVPLADAFTVARIRKAGAVILAKTNLQEFARGGNSISSLGGQVLNPYDLTRTPGGSSGGTGAAIASNLAVLGTGTDTGQSVRSPASACSLVGLRSTRGLISRSGVIPASITQDELGPITRTVADAALLLDVMAGYDGQDPVTGYGVQTIPSSYTDRLRENELKGARIGVMTNMFGTAARHQDVNRVMESVISIMQAKGATIIRFTLPEYDTLQSIVSNSLWEARIAMDAYFAALGPKAPVRSFQQLVDSDTATPDVEASLKAEIAIVDGLNDPTYKDHTLNREKLRMAIASKMGELDIQAILYPLQKVLVAEVGTPQAERNGTLSSCSGFPAICFPGGYSTPTASAPIGVPVGAELLGYPFTEPLLLSLAYSFEQAAKIRKLPRSTPPLPA
jgi:Asp-tRNA(Asn)/Glu-tRNA(Gln) amidotransferase A subunit family amidase